MNATQLTETPSTQGLLWTWGWSRGWADAKSYLAQRIFGSLVALSQPVLERYQGDLYHDAVWIHKCDVAPSEFWFAVRNQGTHLYESSADILSVMRNWPEAIVYHCTLVEDDGHWTFTARLIEDI